MSAKSASSVRILAGRLLLRLTGAINRSSAYKISGAGLLVCGEKGVSAGTWLLFYTQPQVGVFLSALPPKADIET